MLKLNAPAALLVALVLCLPFADAGSVWPQPLNVTNTGRLLYFHRHLSFRAAAHDSDTLQGAFARYEEAILDNSYPIPRPAHVIRTQLGALHGAIKHVSVYVGGSDQSLSLQTSEMYTLTVAAPTTIIESTSVYGALRALETLSQLADAVEVDRDLEEELSAEIVDALLPSDSEEAKRGASGDADGGSGTLDRHHHRHHHRKRHHHHKKHHHHKRRLIVVNETAIYDAPRFRHRGLLIDTGRHFLPLDILKDHLDAMVMAKLNVLHWHLADDQSFPYQSDRLPALSNHGAFAPSAVYTQRDVAHIVDYARSRGIRVLPEFDTPGHTASWIAYPELLTDCCDAQGEPTGEKGPLNPALVETYTVLWQLLREAATAFPDAHVHLGGDEVNVNCWRSNPAVRDFMQQEQFGRDYGRLQAYHTDKVMRLAAAAGKVPVVWQEAADGFGGDGLPENAVVQVWKWSADLALSGSNATTRADAIVIARGAAAKAAAGDSIDARRRVLLQATQTDGGVPRRSPDDYWLDELQRITATHRALLSAPWYLNLAQPAQDEWAELWRVEPLAFKASEEQLGRVIGGEACVWGELVDETNALTKTWPLAAAVAERLWADASVRDEDDARERLQEHRCRMLARGIQAAPLGPGYCGQELG